MFLFVDKYSYLSAPDISIRDSDIWKPELKFTAGISDIVGHGSLNINSHGRHHLQGVVMFFRAAGGIVMVFAGCRLGGARA